MEELLFVQPRETGRRSFSVRSHQVSDLLPEHLVEANKSNSPKKYSTNARSAVPASTSPKTMIGAASSPRLNCSMVAVKV